MWVEQEFSMKYSAATTAINNTRETWVHTFFICFFEIIPTTNT